MRVITINFNGIRSAIKKGFFNWVACAQPDIICCQELKAPANMAQLLILEGYYAYFLPAVKPGYSGVGIYSKKEATHIYTEHLIESEGRYLEAHFDNLVIASIYLPSGTSGELRQAVKYQALDKFFTMLEQATNNSTKEFIICGDFNIAHQNIDLKNWRANQKNTGFLPEERTWLDKVFNNLGFIDSYRHFNPTKQEYTWWSNRGNAYNNNVGWRLDYQIISASLASKIVATQIYREQRFSDHAPFIVDYDIKFKA
jgi:exodeoxyribonuclease-3